MVGKEVVSQLCSARVRRLAQLVSLHTSTTHLAIPPGSNLTSADILHALKAGDGATGGLRPTKYGGGLEAVVAALSDLPRPLVVCDCTSSQELAELYPRLLSQKAVHVVTPNKKAFSGSAALYQSIVENSTRNGNLVYQEATVGAGLPM